MTNLLDIIYYQAYLFYSKRLKEDDPHVTTTWGVGIAFSFIIMFSFLAIKDIFFCKDIKPIYLFGFSLLVFAAFHYFFSKGDRKGKIIREKPLFNGSEQYSKLIAVLYFGFAIAMMFIGPVLAKYFYKIYCP